MDGMYTIKQGLPYILSITIIQDMGIHSNHNMIINKFDLGIKLFEISKEKEEKIEYWQIMNIPVTLKPGQEHPSLNDNVYKGIEFQAHAHLYYLLQKIAEDPKLCSNTRINNIKKQLEEFEDKIISRTKQSISPEDQDMGKLIQRLPSDAKIINDTSSCFFNIIQDIC